MNKKSRLIIIITGVGLVIFFFVKIFIRQNHGFDIYYAEEYAGRIEEIRTAIGSRGSRDVLINQKWHSLGWQSEIADKILVGDSIVKRENSTKIEVFRRDNQGSYNLIVN